MGKWWIEHPNRLTYKEVAFAPGIELPADVFNRWQGFAVDPKPGECSLYLAHIRDNLCLGNDGHYQYLLRWMARMVQYPELQAEVAVVFRGKRGTGKGVFAKVLGRLFGTHYKYVNNPEHVTGKFNAALMDAKLVFADEVFVTDDKKHEAAQMALITEDTIRVEPKGIDTLEVRNFIGLVMATNYKWAIPAALDERRFFILEAGDGNRRDRPYFTKIFEQMEKGGYEALLHHLLHEVDLTGWDHTNVPVTDELRRQQAFSMSDAEKWWQGVLEDGAFDCDTWKERLDRPAAAPLFDMIKMACRRAMGNNDVRAFLKSVGAKKMQGKGDDGTFWLFPLLAVCRKVFQEKWKIKCDWNSRPDWGYPEPEPDGGEAF